MPLLYFREGKGSGFRWGWGEAAAKQNKDVRIERSTLLYHACFFKLVSPRILTNHHCYFPEVGISLDGNHYERWMAFERNGNGEEERQNELLQNLVAITKPNRLAANISAPSYNK